MLVLDLIEELQTPFNDLLSNQKNIDTVIPLANRIWHWGDNNIEMFVRHYNVKCRTKFEGEKP